ncbi:hypothetical protein LQZ19_07890 [Treponema primitia]|uniref:hypothetical protein n=1 Tax=Treponema primitia TaxID=88058 RepID=UPI0039811474
MPGNRPGAAELDRDWRERRTEGTERKEGPSQGATWVGEGLPGVWSFGGEGW